ncbi:hypothetical protein K678_00350 [Magnetospirillum fulvum MGU-K5]|uniref:HTH cro/C1-type domain-containing protein n=2 Tax=Magnetospirillum fulvum TaxID=1082 RepID=S9TYX2_MAGFU|nr:hypothetical protein K678_00350 [Magnetospirillum fulvum MGU-K5]
MIRGMSKREPKIEEGSSDQAKKVHAFLLSRGLSMRGWAMKAGVSASLLSELFSGRTRSLTYSRLLKLAKAAGVRPADIVGADSLSTLEDDRQFTVRDVYDAVTLWASLDKFDDPMAVATAIIEIMLETPEEPCNTA